MDPIVEWAAAQRRVIALVEGTTGGDAGLEVRVPACPEWSARDLLSHLVGLDADVLAGDEPDDHDEAWTQRQVDVRRSRSVADLVAEWAALGPALQTWMRENNARPLNDVVIHEQDLRGALGVAGARDTEGLWSVRDRLLDRLVDRLDGRPLTLRSPDGWSWTAGTADSTADSDGAGDGPVVTASAFDLARAVMSRRSAAQLTAWGAPPDVLDAFAVLGPLPDRDLDD